MQTQKLSCDSSGEARLEGGLLRVEQRLRYTVEYEPLEAVTLDLPGALLRLKDVKFLVEGQPLEPLSDSDTAPSDEVVRRRLALRSPQPPGQFDLIVRYSTPLGEFHRDRSVPVTAPLVAPADAPWQSQRLQVHVEDGLVAFPSGDVWRVADPMAGEASVPGVTLLESSAPALSLTLVAGLEERGVTSETLVEKAWIQSWFTTSGREDRVMYRFTSRRNRLELVLPRSAVEPLQVTLDGAAAQVGQFGDGKAVIETAAAADGRSHVLEIRYRVQDGQPLVQRRMDVAHLSNDDWLGRAYWQIVLPSDEHLLWAPLNAAPAYAWRWYGAHWGRAPLMRHEALCKWIGVADSLSAPPPAANVYLFSSTEPPATLRFTALRRIWIVGAASAGAFVLGLLMIYVRALRGRGALLAAALLLLAVAILYPEPALVIAQSASLGVGLVLLTVLLRRLLSRGRVELVQVGGGSSYVFDRDSTEPAAQRQSPAGQLPLGGGSSTLTAPMATPVPDSRS